MKQLYKVQRCGLDERGWYEVMLSPFSSFEDVIEYIRKYKNYYPFEHQNYKITHLAEDK